MDEAEQLCDQIAIMINGRIVVFGTPSYLMHQYGQGYIFTANVNLTRTNIDFVKQQISQQLPQAEYQGESKHQEAANVLVCRYNVTKVCAFPGEARD